MNDLLFLGQKKRLKKMYKSYQIRKKSADLTALAKIFKTDKWGLHFYTPHYQEHFQKFRNDKISLLEIGVGGHESPTKGGNSLRMWKHYFRNGNIFSIDIFDKSRLQEERIRIFQGSQVDREFLEKLIGITGKLDIIIDDGSHVNEHVIETFQILFSALKDGGIYVVEDTQTSYWPAFGGDANDLNSPSTLMNYFKGITDTLNHQEYDSSAYDQYDFNKHITSMHFYHNMIFIYKGLNNEPSNKNESHKVHS